MLEGTINDPALKHAEKREFDYADVMQLSAVVDELKNRQIAIEGYLTKKRIKSREGRGDTLIRKTHDSKEVPQEQNLWAIDTL